MYIFKLSVLKKRSTNYTERSIGMVTTLGAIIAVLLFIGTILTPIQSSYAALLDSSSLKHVIRHGISLQQRDQHMAQENLCYRSNICRQANDGQNTLGNNNSVTGFTDQSDNLQQAAAAPTTPTASATTITPISTRSASDIQQKSIESNNA